jgi:hypothetical protein
MYLSPWIFGWLRALEKPGLLFRVRQPFDR